MNHIPWSHLSEGFVIKELYTKDGLTDTWIEYKMDRNETIEIRPTQNGYTVEYSYRVMKDNGGEFDYRYVNEKYIYTNWEDVIKYVAEKKLSVPANQ